MIECSEQNQEKFGNATLRGMAQRPFDTVRIVVHLILSHNDAMSCYQNLALQDSYMSTCLLLRIFDKGAACPGRRSHRMSMLVGMLNMVIIAIFDFGLKGQMKIHMQRKLETPWSCHRNVLLGQSILRTHSCDLSFMHAAFWLAQTFFILCKPIAGQENKREEKP
eukprot:1159686-Pelagomonas_calceolata.AAC.10